MDKQRNPLVEVIDLGNKAYKPVWDLQEEKLQVIVDLKRKNRDAEETQPTPNYFYWVEHPPVITLGKSGLPKHLLLNEAQLKEKGVAFFKTNRGGDITFHGPGQLVGYPILDLENFFTDIHKYLRLLEESIILTLNEYGLSANAVRERLSLVDAGKPSARKICAMGVKASRWVPCTDLH